MATNGNTMTVELTGTLPLLMHNERLANPLDPAAKKLKVITSKRKKTDDDLEALSRVEFEGGLYHSDDGPFVPSKWILSMIRDGARITKQGKDAIRAILLLETDLPLKYKGPRDIEGLWNAGFFDRRMVGNQKARVLRTRPRFDKWGVSFTLQFDETVFDRVQIERILETGGRMIGLGDYRPVYGRFDVKVS